MRNRDPLVNLLVDELVKARFDLEAPDHLWCSDSNGSINPIELATKIRALLAKEAAK